jgi:translation initiation factor 5A
MTGKLIDASDAKSGAAIFVDGVACIVKSNDMSKTGKHGHLKCRIEAIGVIDGKKKVFVSGGHERLEVPIITRNKGQVLSFANLNASVMDLETFETIEMVVPEDIKEELKEGNQVEYWDVDGKKIIKKKL